MTMRLFIPLHAALLAFACSSTDFKEDPVNAKAASREGLGALEQAYRLYDGAWGALENNDRRGARQLTKEALSALGQNRVENAQWGRVKLLGDIARFYQYKLNMPSDSRRIQLRHRRAYKMFLKRFAAWEGIPLDAIQGAPVATSLQGGLKRPKSMDDYRAEEPQTLGVASTPSSEVSGEVRPDTEDPDKIGRASDVTGDGPKRATTSVEGSTDQLHLLKRLLMTEMLMKIGQTAEAEREVTDALQGLEGRGLGASAPADRFRELLADSGTADDLQQPGAVRDAVGERTGPGDGLEANAIQTDSVGRVSDAAGDKNGRSFRPFLDTLSAASSEDLMAGGHSLPELGDIAYAGQDYSLARRLYEDSLSLEAGGAESDLRGRMGLARVADALGRGSNSIPLFRQVAEDARGVYPPDHPVVTEARDRHVRAVGEAYGGVASSELLEDILRDQLSSLRADHPAVQVTRRKLADAYGELGDPVRALTYQRQALQSLRRSASDDDPVVSETRLELVELLDRLGEHDAALELAREPSNEPTDPSLAQLAAEALDLQSSCRFTEALDLRRRLVDRQREELSPNHPDRMEGLLDLAALLRVTGDAEAARGFEIEARIARQNAPDDRDRLSAWMAAEREKVASNLSPPHVTLRASGTDSSGRYLLTAEIEAASGVQAVDVLQDKIPLSLTREGVVWTLDPEGTHGHLSIPVSIPEGQDRTVISIAVESMRHAKSGYVSLVLP